MSLRLLQRVVQGIGRRVGWSGAPANGTAEQDARFYDRMYAATVDYHGSYRQSHYYFLWAIIADRVRRAGVRRVLEIGCGPGQLAAFLLDQGVTEYTGLDFSAAALAMARKSTPLGRFVVGDARTTELPTQVDHDLLICTEVLEHVEDDLLVVSRFRPETRCICSVPNFPYESHVRHFQDAAEVVARYGPYFVNLDVMTLPSPRSADDKFFLCDGVRNHHAVDC